MASLLAIFISSKSETPNCNDDCWRELSEVLPFGATAALLIERKHEDYQKAIHAWKCLPRECKIESSNPSQKRNAIQNIIQNEFAKCIITPNGNGLAQD
jgi:hypothetical protein